MNAKDPQILKQARACLRLESGAILATADALDERFCAVVHQVLTTLESGGKLLFTGVGKNVAIAQKLAGTFNSIGGTSCFLDPCQALHGDLGLCVAGDLAFLLSNSGNTKELLALVSSLKRFDIATVLMTANPDAPLANQVDSVLLYRVPREACPLNLAPTASTTTALALGDALAMVYLQAVSLTPDDFARYHPGGNLGQSLLLKVEGIMRTGERFACLPETATVQEAILAITQARCGVIALTDPSSGRLTGVFSDGDLRRYILKEQDILSRPITDYMTRHPKTVRHQSLVVEALKIFEQTQVNDLIVTDDANHPIGIIDGQDLPKLHLIEPSDVNFG